MKLFLKTREQFYKRKCKAEDAYKILNKLWIELKNHVDFGGPPLYLLLLFSNYRITSVL